MERSGSALSFVVLKRFGRKSGSVKIPLSRSSRDNVPACASDSNQANSTGQPENCSPGFQPLNHQRMRCSQDVILEYEQQLVLILISETCQELSEVSDHFLTSDCPLPGRGSTAEESHPPRNSFNWRFLNLEIARLVPSIPRGIGSLQVFLLQGSNC